MILFTFSKKEIPSLSEVISAQIINSLEMNVHYELMPLSTYQIYPALF